VDPVSRGTFEEESAQSTWAILVAAGTGERLGSDRPKAFAALAGRPLLAESLERLDSSAQVAHQQSSFGCSLQSSWRSTTIERQFCPRQTKVD